MKRIYIPLIALGTGFTNAFLAFNVHSLFFCLLPLLAFAFGYFSSPKKGTLIGLLSGFLLFFGYTTTVSFLVRSASTPANMPIDYIYTFILGGWCLCLIGYGAPFVRRKIRSIKAGAVLTLLVLLVSWCTFLSLPTYSYYYQVILESSKGLPDLELYLPVGATSEGPYTEIFNHPLRNPRYRLTENYSLELVETENGTMLKLDIAKLQPRSVPQYNYVGNIIFDMSGISFTSYKELELMPKYDSQAINRVSDEKYVWFMRISARETVEEFTVPLKATSDQDADIMISLECRSIRGSGGINFNVGKGETYTEKLRFETLISDEWALAGGQAERHISVEAAGD